MISISKALSRAVTTAVLGAALALPGSASSAEGGAFADYPGNWSGSGTITIANDNTTSNERIRCRGNYTVSDASNSLNLSLRCASDSYRFDLTSNVRASGGQLTGSWSEASRGVNGTVDGRVLRRQCHRTGSRQTDMCASFNISTRGSRQTVAISSPGDLRAVNISLSRSN